MRAIADELERRVQKRAALSGEREAASERALDRMLASYLAHCPDDTDSRDLREMLSLEQLAELDKLKRRIGED